MRAFVKKSGKLFAGKGKFTIFANESVESRGERESSAA